MKRIIGLLLLLVHINTSMFIPVMDEQDMYDEYGHQVNDINTLTQFISQEIFGNKRIIDKDQDDDQAHYFNIKVHEYTFNFNPVVIISTAANTKNTTQYSVPTDDKAPPSVNYDVIAPPPWHTA
jgi:hypothetical protein